MDQVALRGAFRKRCKSRNIIYCPPANNSTHIKGHISIELGKVDLYKILSSYVNVYLIILLLSGLDHVLEQPHEICKEPTRQEIGYAIQRMRNNRDPGEDTIVAELIKYGGEGVRDAVHELIKLMWTTKYAPGMEYRSNMPDIQERG